MSKDSSKMDKTDEEKIILEFKAFVQKSFLEHGLDVGSEKKVVLSNKAIYVDKFKILLDNFDKIELIKTGNKRAVIIYPKPVTTEDFENFVKIYKSFDPNIEKFFETLKILIPGCLSTIRRDYFGEVKNLIIYAIVLLSGIGVIIRIKEPIYKVPPLLLLVFLTIVLFLNMAPIDLQRKKLKRRIYTYAGFFFIISIIAYIILLFSLYLR